jgi:hypothetical protein
VVLQSFLFNELLGHGITGCEEDCGGDALGEQWARGQLSLVPVYTIVSFVLLSGVKIDDWSQLHVQMHNLPSQHLD